MRKLEGRRDSDGPNIRHFGKTKEYHFENCWNSLGSAASTCGHKILSPWSNRCGTYRSCISHPSQLGVGRSLQRHWPTQPSLPYHPAFCQHSVSSRPQGVRLAAWAKSVGCHLSIFLDGTQLFLNSTLPIPTHRSKIQASFLLFLLVRLKNASWLRPPWENRDGRAAETIYGPQT